jgi:pimeloyl-ACP methyl ester carboxylesterase
MLIVLLFCVLKAELMKTQPRLQGEFESIHRDMNIGFGKWEFDPVDLQNPFQNDNGSVHLWMGDEDRIVPVTLQRYIAQQHGWIKYHEVVGGGHMFAFADEMGDNILKALLKTN